MGVLRHVASGRLVTLSTHTVAGRAPGSAVRLAGQPASNNHASVFWAGERWEVRDLGSTNGTSVNEVTVPLKANAHLALGAVLRFGCDAERWELTDDTGPVALARSLATGEIRRAEAGLLALPDPDNILASIMLDSAGLWLVETSDGARRPAKDREQLTIAGDRWELEVPSFAPIAGTQVEKPAPELTALTLRFHVSLDEVHVQLDALDAPGGEVVVSFGQRACFYALLLLARERRDNAADAHLSEREHGWLYVDDLMKGLLMDERHLNVTVFRIREAFGKAGIVGAEGIVERRPRQMRIGIASLVEIKA